MKNIQIILLLNLLILTMGCNGFVKTGVPQASATINVSKLKGAFIYQYIPDENLIEIGNDKYRIDEAWIEYRWSHIDNDLNVEIDKKFRDFYIKVYNLQTKEDGFESSIEDGFSKFEVLTPDYPDNKYIGYVGGKLNMRLEKNQPIPENIEIKFKGNEVTKTVVFTKLE